MSFDGFIEIMRFAPQKLGTYRLTHASLIDFAQNFDPQPFHLDE